MQPAASLPATASEEQSNINTTSEPEAFHSLHTIVRDSLGAVYLVLALLFAAFFIWNWVLLPEPFESTFAMAAFFGLSMAAAGGIGYSLLTVRLNAYLRLEHLRWAEERHHAELEAITEAKEKAEESNRVKTSIFANISHEIRTPMTAILGFSEILARRLKGNELEEAARRIHSGGRRLLHLLDSIIDLAKIEVDKVELLPSVHGVDESIRHVAELLSILAEQKGLKLHFDVPGHLKVMTDPRREEQVIMNILGNAIKYTDRGSVTIKAELDSKGPIPWVVIKVVDTGCGISDKFIPHVFEEFRQESEGIARSHEGSGLGLSIVKKLVEKMHGEIKITSEKGQGTTVAISFPHVDEPVKAIRLAPNPASFPERLEPVEEYAILYIDDDESCGMLVKEVLSDTHTVVWCDRAEEAIERAVYKRFDVILLDIHLQKGRLDGTQALGRLRDIEGYETVPIFAVTAYAMKGDRERFEALGFNGYVAKPFDSSQLHDAISRMAKGRPADTTARHLNMSPR